MSKLNTTTVGWLAGSAMLLLAAAGWWVDVPYVLAVPVAALLAYWAFARLDLMPFLKKRANGKILMEMVWAII